MASSRPRILCVDDEPNVLHGLRRTLRGRFEVHTAPGGEDALRQLQSRSDFTVICSDMRMPGMDGATLLSRAKELAPDVTRVLLSGQSDIPSLVRVINEGSVYRFLVKPCPKEQLVATLLDAVDQHHRVVAEKELLEGTLLGSVRLLTQVLSLASPSAFGRSERLKQLVLSLARAQNQEITWQLETTASMSQIGLIAIPLEVVQAWNLGRPIPGPDQALLEKSPELGADLLSHIPRLQEVAEAVRMLSSPQAKSAPWVTKALVVAETWLRLHDQELSPESAFSQLRTDPTRFDPQIVKTLEEMILGGGPLQIVEIPSRDLASGMILAQDLRTLNGLMLLPSGTPVQESALARVRNFGLRFGIEEPVRILLTPDEAEALLSA